MLEAQTAGQAETVSVGLERSGTPNNTPITIFNIDTFRPNFAFPSEFNIDDVDGYLEVFRGSGDNWSYVGPDPTDANRVLATTEKVPISDLCCTGLYHFRTAELFQSAYQEMVRIGPEKLMLKEPYVAPLYNFIINSERIIKYHVINAEEVIFCGTPQEYLDFQN